VPRVPASACKQLTCQCCAVLQLRVRAILSIHGFQNPLKVRKVLHTDISTSPKSTSRRRSLNTSVPCSHAPDRCRPRREWQRTTQSRSVIRREHWWHRSTRRCQARGRRYRQQQQQQQHQWWRRRRQNRVHSILVRQHPLPSPFELQERAKRGAKKSSPAAYSYLSSAALDDLQHDYSATLNDVLSHASLRPPNLGIIPGRKAWLLTLDLMILSDAGNIYDALFMAARAALWDTRVPRTRAIEYRPDKKEGGASGKNREEMDVDSGPQSGLDTRKSKAPATDFELEDHWDDGAVLSGREAWPVSVTLNLVPFLPSFFFFSSSLLIQYQQVSWCSLPGRHSTRGGRHTLASGPDVLLSHRITSRASRDALTRHRRH